MIEKLIELLTTIAVALSGAAGLGVANEHASPAPESDGVALAEEHAVIEAAIGLRAAAAERAATEDVEIESVDGLTQATEALEQAMENAPDQGDQGLERASEAVTTNPANEDEEPPADQSSEAPPVTVPADSSTGDSARQAAPAGRP